jgi:hypothetical protein
VNPFISKVEKAFLSKLSSFQLTNLSDQAQVVQLPMVVEMSAAAQRR